MKRTVKHIALAIMILSFSPNAWGDDGSRHEIIFSYNKNEFLKERQFVEDQEDNVEELTTDSPVGISTYDLNNDGIEEIFVYHNNTLQCGAHGCQTEIYSVNDHRKIFTAYTTGQVEVENQLYRGFKIIQLNHVISWKWNGKNYSRSQEHGTNIQ